MSCDVVEDIEDILRKDLNESAETPDDLQRSSNKSFILPKSLKKVIKQAGSNFSSSEDDDGDDDEQIFTSNVPGLASIYVKTWGCTHNSSDSEYMAGQLVAYGYNLVGN